MPNNNSYATRRFSISRKVAILFSILMLIGYGNWLVIVKAQQQLEGAERDINAAGSLRYLSQQIQSTALKSAISRSPASEAENLMAEFEQILNSLEHRSESVGHRSGQAIHKLLPALSSVRAAWLAYRSDVRSFLGMLASTNDHALNLTRLSQQANQVLDQANQATMVLIGHVSEIKQEAVRDMGRLAVIDLAILLLAFIGTRRQIVIPLRQLADVSVQFAGGDYEVRTKYHSHDEIGQVSEAFNYMADQTQQHISMIASDLDEIRQKQEDLNKLSQAVENSPASVIITHIDGTIQYVNPTFTEVTGYSYYEAVGQKPNMLKSGAMPPNIYKDLWRTIQAGEIWRGELMNRRKNGGLFWENTLISSVRNEQGEITHFVAVKEDITARKETEQKLLELNSHLEKRIADRTRRLEDAYKEQESFSYSVSHDLRAPLRAIHGFAHAMAEDCQGCEKTDALEHLKRVQNASLRMSQIIDDMLSLGKISKQVLRVEPTNLSELANSVLETLAAHDPSKQFETVIGNDLIADGDPRLLKIVFENMLNNAWKFTAKQDIARIAFDAIEKDGEKVFFVRDNGAGFNMEYANNLFKPFTRLHSADEFDGTGIGLATVHRIITRHGGRIWAEAENGKGATFFFTLP